MNCERKSERNRKICDQLKLGRKLRGRTRSKIPAPRFGVGIEVLVIPEGMELHKFYGRPVLLPARAEGEELVGRSPYTKRQIEVLQMLVEQRNQTC